MAKLYLILCLVGYCLAQICTVTVPPKPLTAAGLATPYLVEGCNQGDPAATTFVHGAFINPATGAISVYNPLAINKGTLPAIAPRAPVLPAGAVVGIWFGSNSNVVSLKTNGTSLTDGNCVNGGATPFGQFAYCNAPNFFAAANAAIAAGKLVVPALGTAADGQPCPTVREYFVVDMDPSDNVNTAYLITTAGLLAQSTAANKLALPTATEVVNPSDNRLISVAVDAALGCQPWTAPDVADNGAMVTALPLNELFAAANQAPPLALVPAGDPMVLENGQTNLAKLNAYRVGVNQPMANTLQDGDTATFCKFFYNIQPARLKLNQALFTGKASPAPTVANNLFTFLANRYLTAFGPAANGGLGCDTLLGVKNPVTVTTANGIVTAAVVTPPVIPNPNCNIIVPNNPLTAVGLSTPYQLVATKAANGPCNQANPNQASFVQGAIVDVDMGTISVYNPLVIDKGTQPAAAPVVPTLPPNNVVGLWFGSNANVLTLVGAGGAATLTGANCVNGGLNAGLFGQYSYCNAVAFYKAANFVINRGQLTVPPLGTAADGQPCPTTRDFFVVDMDPSDNVVTSYLVTAAGTTAQDTAANRAALPGATVVVNPSDERLVSVAIDGALQCTPWKVPDLANPGSMVPALPVNELFAARNQKFPQARVPENDPMVVDGNGNANLGKLNAYRAGVNQFAVQALGVANTTRFCNRFGNIAPNRLMAAQAFLTNAASPDPNAASNLFNFLCNRFNTAYGAGGLNCVGLLNVQTPITTTQDQNAVVVSCTINLALVPTLDLTPDVDSAVSDLGDTNVKPPNPSLLPTIVQPTILLGGSSLVTPLVVLILSVILLLL